MCVCGHTVRQSDCTSHLAPAPFGAPMTKQLPGSRSTTASNYETIPSTCTCKVRVRWPVPPFGPTRNERGRRGLPNRADFENAGAETRQRHWTLYCTTCRTSSEPAAPAPSPSTGSDIRPGDRKGRGGKEEQQQEECSGHRAPNAAGPAVSVGPSCMLVFLIFSALERGALPRAHVRPCPKLPSLLGGNHISTTSRVPAARRAGTQHPWADRRESSWNGARASWRVSSS